MERLMGRAIRRAQCWNTLPNFIAFAPDFIHTVISKTKKANW
jgi:hypothetical protein